MRRCAPAVLLLLAVGCSSPSNQTAAPSPIPTEGWVKHEVRDQGISFEIPPKWQIANEVNGKIEVKQDQEALAQAKSLFNDIRLVSSASEPMTSGKKLLTTYTILVLSPKKMPASADELLHATLKDLVADYPNGDPKGAVFEVPSGPAVLTTYTDSATKGQSKGGAPEVVEVQNIQFRILHKNRIFLLNVTGEKKEGESLQKLAEALLRKVSLS